jgi:hypothetical protein
MNLKLDDKAASEMIREQGLEERSDGFVEKGLQDYAKAQPQTSRRVQAYNTPAQQALVQQGRQWKQSGTGQGHHAELHRHVLGGGGTDKLFESVYAELIEQFNREQQAIAAGTFHAAFGGLTYLVSGRKV